ncbi:hypothetical protein EHI44_03835 [Rhizobium leguminosarum]|nr:hypothetical protein EHI44_03835 [Rhizobium leguminosarum]TAY71574.1 hypothetical protein ELH83_33735 [Rhizobium leguminosarum]
MPVPICNGPRSAPEQRVTLSFETAKVHFFDRETQQRLKRLIETRLQVYRTPNRNLPLQTKW